MKTRSRLVSMASALGASALLLVSPVHASVVGDSYDFAAANFPVDIAKNGPLTFNNVGDTTPEPVPGSGGTSSVMEVFGAGLGALGGDLLGFVFTFSSLPASPGPFAFQISGLNVGAGATLLGASLGIKFANNAGVASTFPTSGLADVLSVTTATFNGDDLDLTVQIPVGWSDIFNASNPPANLTPDTIVTTFVAEIRRVPEPSSLSLIGIAAFGLWRNRRTLVN